MTPPADIGWVEPAKPIRGLDHLGVQAPCIALYTQLLPGITNVTDPETDDGWNEEVG